MNSCAEGTGKELEGERQLVGFLKKKHVSFGRCRAVNAEVPLCALWREMASSSWTAKMYLGLFFGSTVIDQVTKWGMTKIKVRVFCFWRTPKKTKCWGNSVLQQLPHLVAQGRWDSGDVDCWTCVTFGLSFVGLRAFGSSVTEKQDKTLELSAVQEFSRGLLSWVL